MIVLGVFGGCALLWWLASRLEPAWASSSGNRFLVVAQELAAGATEASGSPKEVRGTIQPTGEVLISRRVAMRRRSAAYRVVGEIAEPKRGKREFLLEAFERNAGHPDLVLRMPTKCAAADALAAAAPRGSAKL